MTPLEVGKYSVAVEATGFKRSVRPDIQVNVQDRVRVDAKLEVGQVTDTVQVEAAAPILETDTSYLGEVVDSQRIVDLPLNGRFFTRLAVLTAGTAPTPAGARDENTGGFSANGVRPYQNNYILDGVDNNSLSEDLSSQTSFVVGPPPDAIQEFKVQTNSMSAEFGRSGGAVLNVTIKSGTNDLHGTAYEFLRNSDLDANNFFNNAERGSDCSVQAKSVRFQRRRAHLDPEGLQRKEPDVFLLRLPGNAYPHGANVVGHCADGRHAAG